MGDLFHSLPALSELKEHFPELTIDWLVDEQFSEVPAWSLHIRRVISVPLRGFKRHKNIRLLFSAVRKLRQVKYDVVIDAQGLLKSALIARLARTKCRHGYARHTIREPVASIFYNKKHDVKWDMHAVMRIRLLLSSVFDYSINLFAPLHYGVRKLHASNLFPTKTLVCCVSTSWSSKHWPKAYWRKLFSLLGRSSCAIQLVWGSLQERRYAEQLAQGFSHVALIPPATITEVAAYIQQCDAVVAVDTGFAHLAQVFDVPLVALYGPTAPSKTGPLGQKQQVLSADFSCAPCFKRRCDYKGEQSVSPACYSSIPPEKVLDSLVKLGIVVVPSLEHH
jgi:heptosyltransferase I